MHQKQTGPGPPPEGMGATWPGREEFGVQSSWDASQPPDALGSTCGSKRDGPTSA
jgi:hypothetical protein